MYGRKKLTHTWVETGQKLKRHISNFPNLIIRKEYMKRERMLRSYLNKEFTLFISIIKNSEYTVDLRLKSYYFISLGMLIFPL
ncbi:hypothetical protein A3863_05610 [Priestia endophytica]|uniref:Uncharacterized protein n=2 Tax=Priestia endophytica TaxID=135735 RepID=A0AAX1Q9E6_9BACI|nr:hypothetical protein A3864_12965 [Priestia endophytica]RAS91686.1 hypothetical protein A3863_05610 [Priestia endophytica]